jgi:hypothetical protein
MNRLLALATVAVGAAASGSAVLAQEPPSWPSGTTQVFISADTVTAKSRYGYVPPVLNKQENFFPRTAGVKFRMYAVDLKTKKVLTRKAVKFAYVAIPGQPSLKLRYGKQGARANAPRLWTGTWSIPPDYPLGVVAFRILVRTKANRIGRFQQAPVAAAQLTVIAAPTGGAPAASDSAAPGNAAAAPPPFPSNKVEIAMYADTVSSSRGEVKQSRVCTQTNYFPRRSRVVFRMWAVDTKTGLALTALDVSTVYVRIPGQPNLNMNFGPHGAAANRVNFWSAAWAIPADYPLGVVPFRIIVRTVDGRTGTYRQPPIAGSQLTVTP